MMVGLGRDGAVRGRVNGHLPSGTKGNPRIDPDTGRRILQRYVPADVSGVGGDSTYFFQKDLLAQLLTPEEISLLLDRVVDCGVRLDKAFQDSIAGR